MSINTKRISNSEAISRLDDISLFEGHDDMRFALGVVAESTTPPAGFEALYREYLRLRANVYISQADILDESYRLPDGTESDTDDERSVHIVAIENRLSHIAVVGSMRVIQKTPEFSEQLPFEHSFDEDELPIGADEISRYINRHDDRRAAAEIRSGLFLTALAVITMRELSPTVAIVEQELESRLQAGGVPLERVADPKEIEKYNSTNIGIRIDTKAFTEQFGGISAMASINTTPGGFVYWGEANSNVA